MRTKGSPDELEHRRQLAVRRYLEGYSADEIAEFLGISTRSVWRWLASFRDRGPEGLAAPPVPGRPPKLTVTQEKIVLRWLRGSPIEHGFASELWTARRLAQLIAEEFSVRFNPRALAGWLRDRGFTPQKPERIPRERDPGAISAWLASDWPRIKKKARRQGAHIALIDESGLMMAPLARRTWAPRGQTPALAQCGAHRKKVSVAAALWLSPRRDRLGLYFHTLADGYFDNWYVTAFLEAMLHDLRGRFVVVRDGGSMHKGEPIRELEAHFSDRLVLERLPPFAPVLNPVECLWGWLKYSRLNNFAPRDPAELDGRVTAELTAVHGDQAFLRNLFHASELPIPLTLLS
ncbi:MAG TPA: IS630 family transposase [Isosphaeraceae bacterium]|nr:IS630 family transposase [Isosphaeraceae bacterium]